MRSGQPSGAFDPASLSDLPVQTRVVLSQLPLTCTTAIVLLETFLLSPEALRGPLLQLSVVLHVLILVLCLVVPWQQLHPRLALVIPLMDFVPILLTREGVGGELTALGFLCTFPMIWLAASGLPLWSTLLVAVLAPLVVVWAPLFARGGLVSGVDLARPALLPLIMVALSLTIWVITGSLRGQRHALEAKEAALQAELNVSARRRGLLDTVMNAVDVGVVAFGVAGEGTLVNDKLRALRQQIAQESSIELFSADTFTDSDVPMFDAEGRTRLEDYEKPLHRAGQGQEFSGYLIRFGEEPHQRMLSTSARVLRSGEGHADGAVVSFTDITDLVAALKARDDFVSNMSHELRTPLTSIKGYAEMMVADPQAPEHMTGALGVVQRNADRLLNMINDLLDSSSSSATEVRPAPTDFARVVTRSIASCDPKAGAAGVRLLNSIEGPLSVFCDPVRMEQVLDNLLSNAIKYSPDGGTVTVRAERTVDGVVCTVEDTGMGMSESDQAAVFTKYFRSPGVRMSTIPGTGLGLAITKKIIEQHGGSITCTSRLGQGTLITFTLPFHTVADQLHRRLAEQST